MVQGRKAVHLGGLQSGRRTARPSNGLYPEVNGVQAATEGARARAGWDRASQTSGRKAGDMVAVGAIVSPRLCRLGLHCSSQGNAAVPVHHVSRGATLGHAGG